MDESFVLQALGAEVEQQASLVARGFQVVDDLRVLRAAKRSQCFELDDDFVEATEVCAVGARKVRPFV